MGNIKVLVIDQMGVLLPERTKYEELAKHKNLSITALVPQKWRFNFRLFEFEPGRGNHYDIIALPVSSPGYGHRSFFLDSLRQILTNLKPDIIHIFQEPYSFFAAQVVGARKLYCPDARIIFITWQNLYFGNYPFVFSKLYSFIEKYTYKNSVCATPITQSANEILTQKGYGKKSLVINWGIDLKRFTKKNPAGLRQELGIENRFVVGYAGRFVGEKGILDLVKAVSGIEDDVAILLVGDGPLKSQIESIAHALNLRDRLIIVSAVSNSEIARYLNCMDVLVLPSKDSGHWKEQLGKVLIEAMACEVPVIGSDSGEIPNVIDNQEMIFSAGDHHQLKEKIKLMKSTYKSAQRSARKAKERVHRIYSWQSIAKNLHNLYGELMQE
ncbi:MAG: glycosyltransferase [bacterium]